MIRPVDRPRHAGIRLRPRCEVLESRIALASGGGQSEPPPYIPMDSPDVSVSPQVEPAPLSVDLVDPAPNATLTSSPPSLLLAFNRPILPDTVETDVVVVRVDSQGDPIDYLAPYDLTVDDSAM